MLRRLAVAASVLLAVLALDRAAAAQQPAPVQSPPVLRVLLNDAPPYRIVSRAAGGAQYSGIYVDILAAAAARTGLALRFIEVPYARAFAMMAGGEGDVMLGPNRTAERERYLLYLEPALPAEPKVFVTRAEGPALARYDDLRGLRIATLRGAHHADGFDTDPALQRIAVTDYGTALRMLEGRRVDSIIIPELRARWLLRDHADLRLGGYRIPGEPSYIVLARASPQLALAGRLAAALRDLQQAGEVERILALYS